MLKCCLYLCRILICVPSKSQNFTVVDGGMNSVDPHARHHLCTGRQLLYNISICLWEKTAVHTAWPRGSLKAPLIACPGSSRGLTLPPHSGLRLTPAYPKRCVVTAKGVLCIKLQPRSTWVTSVPAVSGKIVKVLSLIQWVSTTILSSARDWWQLENTP